MDRTLINQELEKFGITEEEYMSYLEYLLDEMHPQDIAKTTSLTAIFRKEYITAESYIDPEKGPVHEEEETHVDYLEITEKDDFLEVLKMNVLGEDLYIRFLL